MWCRLACMERSTPHGPASVAIAANIATAPRNVNRRLFKSFRTPHVLTNYLSAMKEKAFVRFPLTLTIEERNTLKRRADAAGLSMHAYAVSVLTNGKVNHKRKP